MEQEFFLLLLSLLSIIIGFALERYGLSKYRKPTQAFIKALEDRKVTKEEMQEILNLLATTIGENDDNRKTV